jgi:hypothetical protein
MSLTGLVALLQPYIGHIEDLDDEKRIWLLGVFIGGVSRLRARVRELYRQADEDDQVEAMAQLRQVALALGEPEDWERGEAGQ